MKKPHVHHHVPWMPVCAVTIAGCVTSAIVAWIGQPWLTITLVGTLLSLLAALIWQLIVNRRRAEPSLLETPFYLAHDAEVFDRYRKLAHEMLRISGRSDPIYRKCALSELDAATAQLATVGDGKIVFNSTESWRLIYEKLLCDPSVTVYRSVALVRAPAYWQDGAGSQSMRLNFDLLSKSIITIERTVIIQDELWPAGDDLPGEVLRQWIHEQSVHGIWIRLVRGSDLQNEPDLLRDMGIYGFSAVGFQEFDSDHLRTSCFTLDFELAAVREAEARWKRLNVYAVPYKDLLDQFRLNE